MGERTLDDVLMAIETATREIDEAATALALSEFERANILLRRARITLDSARPVFNLPTESPCSRP